MQNKSNTPEQYFSYKMDDIKAVPIGAEKYDYMVNLVHELRKCRHSKDLTQKVLNPFLKTPFENKEEVEEWLMSALWNDDSFVYAYNCMVEDQNVTGRRFIEKLVSERELHNMLLIEQEETKKQQSSSVEEMPSQFTASNIHGRIKPERKQELTLIFEKAIKANVIECSKESFLYWFGGKHGWPQPEIRWKKLNNKSKFHKNALHWFCRKINPEMNPKEMSDIFGRKILPQNKYYTPEDVMLDLFK